MMKRGTAHTDAVANHDIQEEKKKKNIDIQPKHKR